MHTPTDTWRRCASPEIAALVAQDFVRGMDHGGWGIFLNTFLTPDEREIAEDAYLTVPEDERFQGVGAYSDDELVANIALFAKNEETFEAIAKSFYANRTLAVLYGLSPDHANVIRSFREQANPNDCKFRGREGKPIIGSPRRIVVVRGSMWDSIFGW